MVELARSPQLKTDNSSLSPSCHPEEGLALREDLTHIKVVAAIPCYNTQRNIANVVMRTKQYVEEVVVIDDGSTDMTADLARSAGAIVISHDKNRGKGSAMKTALANIDADILVFIDGDGQHNPEDIPKLLSPILLDEADFVIGSRFLSGSRTDSTPLGRRIANHVASIVISCIISLLQPLVGFIIHRSSAKKQNFNTKTSRRKYSVGSAFNTTSYKVLNGRFKWISDCTSGFTAMRKENWNKLNLVSDRFQIETEIIFEQAKNGFIIAEVPISCTWKGSLSSLSVMNDGLKTLFMLSKKIFAD